MKGQRLFVVSSLCPLILAQSHIALIITVAVWTCPASSLSSLATTLPTWSSLPYSGSGQSTVLSSMQPPAASSTNSPRATTASTGATSSGAVSEAPIPIPSYASGDNLTSTEGNLYAYRRDTALTGTTINAAVSGMRKRQNPDQYRPLFDCLEQCDGTSACVAVTLLGQSCLLYAAVERTTYLLGAQAAFDIERFTGYVEPTPPSYSSTPPDDNDVASNPAPYSTPYLTSPRVPASPATSAVPVQSSSYIDNAPPSPRAVESLPEAYSTPLLSTNHGTSFTPPPPTTSIGSTMLPVTLSMPSSLASPSSEVASSSERPPPYLNPPALSSASALGSSSFASSVRQSRSESPLVSVTSSNVLASMSLSSGALSSSPVLPSSSIVPPEASSNLEQYSPTTALLPSTYATSVETGEATTVSSSDDASPPVPSTSSAEITTATSTEDTIPSETMQEAQTTSSSMESPAVYESSSDTPEYFTTTSSNMASSSSASSSAEAPGEYQQTTSPSVATTSTSSFPQSSSLVIATSSSRVSSAADSSIPASSSSSPTVLSSISSATSTTSSVSLIPSAYVSSISSSMASSSSAVSTSSLRSMTSSSTRASTTSSSSSTKPPFSSTSSSSTRPSASLSSLSRTASSSSSTTRSSSASPSSVPSAYPVRNAGKRGLCYTDDLLTQGYSLSGQNSQVSWGYNYYYRNQTSDNSPGINPALDFVPLLFNDSPDLMAKWPANAQIAIDNGAEHLMGFNEPDLCFPGSACMSVNQSVIAWRQAMEPFAGKVRLGAPAVTNGGPPSSLQWLGEFMGNCTGCTIDFVPIHWYANVYAFSYLQYYVQLAYNVTQKPIWVTEFGIDSSGGSEAQYQSFMQMSLAWLDAVPYVERYAWFYDGPGYLINSNGSGLSAQGMIYNSYTAPCPNWQNSAGHC